MFRTDFDNATAVLGLAILDNTDHIQENVVAIQSVSKEVSSAR